MHPLVEASRDHFISKARRKGEASPVLSVKQRQTDTNMGIRELFAGGYGYYIHAFVFKHAHVELFVSDICFQ